LLPQLNKVIHVYNRGTLKLVRRLSGHTDHIWSLDMNGKWIVSGSWDGTVKVREINFSLRIL
jgi:WD40 repeat protein